MIYKGFNLSFFLIFFNENLFKTSIRMHPPNAGALSLTRIVFRTTTQLCCPMKFRSQSKSLKHAVIGAEPCAPTPLCVSAPSFFCGLLSRKEPPTRQPRNSKNSPMNFSPPNNLQTPFPFFFIFYFVALW